MSLLRDLQRRLRRYLVRAAFSTDPRELRDMLRELRQRSLRMHRLGLELEQELEQLSRKHCEALYQVDKRIRDLDKDQEALARRNLDAFLFVARYILNEDFSRLLGLNLNLEVCPTCDAAKLTHCCGGDRPAGVCVARHVAALDSLIQHRAEVRARREREAS